MYSQPQLIKIMPDFAGYATDQMGRAVQLTHCFMHHPNQPEICCIEQELKTLAQDLSFTLLQGRRVQWQQHELTALELAKRLAWAIGLIEIPILYSSHYCNHEQPCQRIIDVTLPARPDRRIDCYPCDETPFALN